jgi:hypothetical protein
LILERTAFRLVRYAAVGSGFFALAWAVRSAWRQPPAALLFLLLAAASVFAAAAVVRGGAGTAALFLASSACAAASRLLHGFATGAWYVDYVAPVGACVEPMTRVPTGLAGLLRSLSVEPRVLPGFVFAMSLAASSVAIGFLTAALRRHERSCGGPWPCRTSLAWAVLLAADAVLASIGASDAHHNVAFLAFGLAFWCYGEALARQRSTQAPPCAWLLAGMFIGSAFVGLTRVELILSPLVIPLLLPGAGAPETGRIPLLGAGPRGGWASLGLGTLFAWIVVSQRHPHDLMALYHPRTAGDFVRCLYMQSPLVASLPPLLDQPMLSVLTAVFLAAIVTREGRPLWGTAAAYAVLILPKVLGGFGMDPIRYCDDTQRYNVVIIALALLMAACGLSQTLGLLVGRQRPMPTFRRWGAAAGIACAVLWAVVKLAGWPRQRALPRPHQVEFAFLARSLPEIPAGATVVSVWLEQLHSRQDVDLQLAVPHALLVHARPDIRWTVCRPGGPALPKGPFLYYRGSTCNIDLARAYGRGGSEGWRLLQDYDLLCRSIESRVTRWQGRQSLPVQEGYMPVREGRIEVGLGWVE